jgi:putative peptide zinc metalloprotease protein
MSSLFSPSWYRVAALRPRLRGDARFFRHHYRDRLWYVVRDPAAGRVHRLSPAAYRLVALMDGARTTQEIWERLATELGDDAPTQDETIELLALLHGADLLRCDVTPDVAELFRRTSRREREAWWRRFANPLAIRLRLFDPDAWLTRWLPFVRPVFSPIGVALWSAVVVGAVVAAAASLPELAQADATRLLDPANLLLLLLVVPVVKALHELGHAFATRVWGGEVHEVGLLFVVFTPLPYVDCSSATLFPDKRHRMAVGAAGIAVELFLASLALLVWLQTEPGLVRTIAYDVLWVGGVSTLLFNGNPLLGFDGYYVLADAIEIPNLRVRAAQYLEFLALRLLLGAGRVREPATAPGEKAWFVCYGVASFVYRTFVLFVIALFLSRRYFGLGLLLAGFAIASQIVWPLLRGVGFLLHSPALDDRRPRVLAGVAAATCGVALLLCAVPLPLSTRAEGVVWPPEDAQVRARADGFVVRVLAEPGAQVRAGDPLVLSRDPALETSVAVLEAGLRALQARHYAAQTRDPARAALELGKIDAAEAALARARERARDAVIRSPADGRFELPRATDLPDRFLKTGDLVGYVVGPSISTIRVVVSQSDAALVRDRTLGVELRLRSRMDEVIEGEIRREVPAATDRLPSRALGTGGGGRIPVDPHDTEGLRTLETTFQVDVGIPPATARREIGTRVYVKFDHGAEPVVVRAYRALRRLFLRQIDV